MEIGSIPCPSGQRRRRQVYLPLPRTSAHLYPPRELLYGPELSAEADLSDETRVLFAEGRAPESGTRLVSIGY